MDTDRFEQQVRFIIEIDRLKHVFRQTLLMNGQRYENDAEHSWHLGMLVLLLSEHAAERNLDVLRVMKMVLIHDLVEIDAGDTFCYDEKGALDKDAREEKAADRLFGMLPADQRDELRALWREFEERRTPEAKFAAALDRFQPLLHNYNTQGAAWRKHGVTRDKVIARNRHIAEGAPELWRYASAMIEDAVKKGYLPA